MEFNDSNDIVQARHVNLWPTMRTILFAQWLSAQFFKNLGHAVYKNLGQTCTRHAVSKTQQLVHTCQSSTFTVRRYGASGLDIGYVPAGPHAFFRSSGQFGPQQFILCWPAGPVAFRSVANACTSFFCWRIACRRAMGLTSIFIHRVILPVRTSIKAWLTNSIRHVTKLLMPKLNN